MGEGREGGEEGGVSSDDDGLYVPVWTNLV